MGRFAHKLGAKMMKKRLSIELFFLLKILFGEVYQRLFTTTSPTLPFMEVLHMPTVKGIAANFKGITKIIALAVFQIYNLTGVKGR